MASVFPFNRASTFLVYCWLSVASDGYKALLWQKLLIYEPLFQTPTPSIPWSWSTRRSWAMTPAASGSSCRPVSTSLVFPSASTSTCRPGSTGPWLSGPIPRPPVMRTRDTWTSWLRYFLLQVPWVHSGFCTWRWVWFDYKSAGKNWSWRCCLGFEDFLLKAGLLEGPTLIVRKWRFIDKGKLECFLHPQNDIS